MDEIYTAFHGSRRLATGPLIDIIAWIKTDDLDPSSPLIIFNDHTGRPIDLNLRGEFHEILSRAQPSQKPAGRGRP